MFEASLFGRSNILFVKLRSKVYTTVQCILQSDCSPQPFVLLKQQGTLRTAFEATTSLSPIPNQMIWDAAFNRRLRETVSTRFSPHSTIVMSSYVCGDKDTNYLILVYPGILFRSAFSP